ncbi:aspartate/glutamate racemase family protein [Leptolyngbya cf. ectocarpi LEGE 11479]|uniref:Aspartate/glutamate racemase family protein n=2 Tax=Leptolyngbya ectocarpi TaxID=1202 RepID=A0A928ZS39_LEPEC|nr:aspartate/glutamate racemase family protein [Leptolyngbya cf. ectocarpi LEGE 11479]
MGPLASAEFLKTIYEYSLTGESEQESPRVVVYSDPTLPDRTQILLSGESEPLLSKLIEALHQLSELKARRIIICCVTSHYLLAKLPADLQERIICLVDIILSNIIEQKKKHLLLCTTGTRRLKIFSQHPLWGQAKEYIILPDDSDQQTVHNMIYQIKTNGISIPVAYQHAECLAMKYNADSVIAGCTELHLLSKFSINGGEFQAKQDIQITFFDPLVHIAQSLAS